MIITCNLEVANPQNFIKILIINIIEFYRTSYLLFFFFQTDCVFTYTRPLMACFAEEGISVSIQSAVNPNVPDALVIQKHRIGSIVLLDGLNLTSPENVLHVVRNTWTNIISIFWFGDKHRRNVLMFHDT